MIKTGAMDPDSQALFDRYFKYYPEYRALIVSRTDMRLGQTGWTNTYASITKP